MTEERKKELVVAMQECAFSGEEELAHIEGDQIVSAALRELGFPELADEYDRAKQKWWYS